MNFVAKIQTESSSPESEWSAISTVSSNFFFVLYDFWLVQHKDTVRLDVWKQQLAL